MTFLWTVAFTPEEQRWIADHPTVTLGSDYSWAPYDFRNKQGKHSGISADFLALISKKIGLHFEVKTGVWAEILAEVKAGKLDGLSCAVKTPEREKFLTFSPPYVSMPLAIIVQKEKQGIHTIDDLVGKSVAVNKGSYLHEWLKTSYPEIKLYLTSSNDASLEAVSFAKADAYIGNIVVASYGIKTHYLSNLKIVNRVEGMDTEVSVALRKEHTQLQNIINKALKSIGEEAYTKIVEKWYTPMEAPEKRVLFTKKEQAWIDKHPTVLVGVDKVWEPFDFMNSQGKHDGMSADYLRLISEKTGLHFKITDQATWTDVLKAAKEQSIDMIAAIAPTKERQKFLTFTEPYMQYAFVLASANNGHLFYQISDFNGKRLGVIKSYITDDILTKQYPEVEVVRYENLQSLLKAVATHEVDGLLDNAVSVAYYIKMHGFSHIKMVTIGEQKRAISMGVTKNNPILHTILNKVLASLSSVEKQKIRDRWISLEYEKTIDYTLVYQILGLFFIFIVGSWLWYRRLRLEGHKREESEAQMRMLIENIPLSVIVNDFEGSVLRANMFALDTFHIKSEELASYNVMDFYADSRKRDELLKTIQEEGKVNNKIVKFKRLDGTTMDIMLSIIPIMYDTQKAMLSIMVDLTERIEIEEALRTAKKVADTANKSKSEFLANMSHEIRTPMNAIMGFTELLNEQVKEPRLRSYTKVIQNAGKSLLTLINDILDLSKIEAGKLEIHKTAVDVHGIVSDVVSIFSMTAAKKGLSIVVDIDEALPQSLLLDGIRLRQVLLNLVGNAVKFTAEGYIKISVHICNVEEHLSKLDLKISVEDTGIGIPETQREHIFSSFEQQEGQDNRKYGGTGLGLSISKRLVEMMGGSISIESVEKQGAVFSIYLHRVDISSLTLSQEESVTEVKTEVYFKEAKILVVDDIEYNRELIIKNFEETAIEIMTASDGLEAIAQVKKEKPDLILMDIRMPIMDGYEAAQQIKSISNVPIIALTASVMEDEYEQDKSKNFNSYLRKPILRKDLFTEIQHYLAYDVVSKKVDDTVDATLILDESTLIHIEAIVAYMASKVDPLYVKALESNSITDIEAFSMALSQLAIQYNITVLHEFVSTLNAAIDTFDIVQIQTLLQNYKNLDWKFKQL